MRKLILLAVLLIGLTCGFMAAQATGTFTVSAEGVAAFIYMGTTFQADLQARVDDIVVAAKKKRVAQIDILTQKELQDGGVLAAIDAAVIEHNKPK